MYGPGTRLMNSAQPFAFVVTTVPFERVTGRFVTTCPDEPVTVTASTPVPGTVARIRVSALTGLMLPMPGQVTETETRA